MILMAGTSLNILVVISKIKCYTYSGDRRNIYDDILYTPVGIELIRLRTTDHIDCHISNTEKRSMCP